MKSKVENKGETITEEALQWIGTPFSHHSAIKGKGADCIGFFIGVLKKIGYLDKDYKAEPYPFDWMLHKSEEKLLKGLVKYSSEVKRENLLPGDLLLFKFGRAVSHAGIYLKDNLFIHCWTKRGVCISILKNSLWEQRFVKAVRLNYEKLPIST